MTPTNRAIWSDAYRLMEAFETPPSGDYDANKEYWDGLAKGIGDFCIAHKNHPLSWKLSIAIHEYLCDEHAFKEKIPDKVMREIVDDSKHMLFSQQGAEQMRLEV